MSAYTTIKVRYETWQLIRRIIAETDETTVELMDRLTRAEWERLQEPAKPDTEWRGGSTLAR